MTQERGEKRAQEQGKRPGKRERNAQLRRAALLEAGERLGREKGWAALSVEDITQAAGVSKGSFYTYFPTKQALRAALEAQHFADVADQIPVIALSSDPISGIAAYLAHLVDLATSGGPEGARRIIALVSQAESMGGADQFFSYARLLRAFADNRLLRRKTPVPALTAALDALTIGLIVVWAADPDRDAVGHGAQERAITLTELAIRRILKPWIRKDKGEKKDGKDRSRNS